MTLLDGGAQGRARSKEVRLANELVEALWPHPHRQWATFDACTSGVTLTLGVCSAWILAKEGIHRNEYRVCGAPFRPVFEQVAPYCMSNV
jgi:hypothetical protein